MFSQATAKRQVVDLSVDVVDLTICERIDVEVTGHLMGAKVRSQIKWMSKLITQVRSQVSREATFSTECTGADRVAGFRNDAHWHEHTGMFS